MEHNKPNIVVIAASCEQRGFRYSMANCMFEAAFEVCHYLFSFSFFRVNLVYCCRVFLPSVPATLYFTLNISKASHSGKFSLKLIMFSTQAPQPEPALLHALHDLPPGELHLLHRGKPVLC